MNFIAILSRVYSGLGPERVDESDERSFLDNTLLVEFISESREHLDGIEPDLMALDGGAGQADGEMINRIFRAIHSIKGGAGFLAFDHLKRLSHAMENVLMEIREQRISVDTETIDLLLRGVDKLRAMLDDIEASDTIPIDDELAALTRRLGRESAPGAGMLTAEATTVSPGEGARPLLEDELATFGLRTDELRARHSDVRYLFRVTLSETGDLKPKNLSLQAWKGAVAPLGDLIGEARDSEAGLHVFLLSTVLEPELAGLALELPENQIELVRLATEDAAAEPEPPAARVTIPRDAIGRILIEHFGVNAEDVIAAARMQGEGDRRQLGAILLAAGCINPENIVEALVVQEQLRQQIKPHVPQAQKAGKAVPTEKAAVPPQTAETVRVRVDVLSRLMNSTGELVLARNQILRALEPVRTQLPGLEEMLQNFDAVTSDLQDGVMQTRVQSVGLVFGRFNRVVRDVARTLGKEIALHAFGGDVELDKSIVEALADPLTHLVRNSADHGIELPDERIRAGKPREGNITLHAFHEGGQVHITISDDGRGLDHQRLVAKAIERGIVTQEAAAALTVQETNNLIFAPGFSTAEKVTDLSGRGVGMDVVRTNIEKLGGVVNIESTYGEGTIISLQLPLTLAIIQTIVVGSSGVRFAIPQVNIEEFVWVKAAEVHERIEQYHGNDVLRLRGRLLPLVHLGKLLGLSNTIHATDGGEIPDRRERIADRRGPAVEASEGHGHERGNDRRQSWHSDYNIVVARAGKNCFGIIVDTLLDMEEIVVKPLSAFLKDCRCFSGATILGDGQVILILDVPGISSMANLSFADLAAAEMRQREEELRREAESNRLRQSVLLLRGGADEQFAMAQATVSRLERILPENIQRMGEREYIDYRGQAVPLLRLDQFLPVHPLPESARELFLVIPKAVQRPEAPPSAGILVAEIRDARDIVTELTEDPGFGPGVRGSALVDNRITYFIEPQALLAAAGYETLGAA